MPPSSAPTATTSTSTATSCSTVSSASSPPGADTLGVGSLACQHPVQRSSAAGSSSTPGSHRPLPGRTRRSSPSTTPCWTRPATPSAASTRRGRSREPIVVALAVDPQRFRQPQSFTVEPWRLAADAEPWYDRLHFLVWANTYDARTETPGVVVGGQGRPPRRPCRGDAGRAGRHPVAGRLRRHGSTAARGHPSRSIRGRSSCTASRSMPACCPSCLPPSRRPPRWPPTSSLPSPMAPDRRGSSHRPGRARRGCSPSACVTSTSIAATSVRPSSPSPTTSRPSWRWSRAPPTSRRACARSTRSACGCSPSTAAARLPCSTNPRCAG